MTKQEIEKAIKNGESVWVVFNQYSYENDTAKEIEFSKVENINLCDNYFQYFDNKNLYGYFYERTFKTEDEAEHYLHHANVERFETLTFVTWEEFKNGKSVEFVSKYGRTYLLKKKYGEILLIWINVNNSIASWDLTEANFYKAYDECVRLFRGGE